MKEELDALHKPGTLDLVDLPSRKSSIGCKWVYKIKTRSDGTVDFYKTRLVDRVLLRSMGLIMRRLLLQWLDFLLSGLLLSFLQLANGHSFRWMSKMLFLNGELSEEVYMKLQPSYSHPPGFPHRVFRLR